jgi:hypothetical protein
MACPSDSRRGITSTTEWKIKILIKKFPTFTKELRDSPSLQFTGLFKAVSKQLLPFFYWF